MCNENLNCYNTTKFVEQNKPWCVSHNSKFDESQIVGNDDVESNRGGSVVEV